MFKRVEKRRRKKEEEEELGLDDDMKEVLGVQDTDSDESDSDSKESDTGIEKAGESDANEEENVDGESSDGKDIELSVEDALEDPVYLVSLELDTKACIVCPGKVLKHPKMIEVHKASGAHRRRFARFAELASHANPGDRALHILQKDGTAKADDKASRRSEKRKAKLAVIKAKREHIKQKKAMVKAKQKEKAAEAKAMGAAVEEPAKKKRKLDQEEISKRTQHQPPSLPRGDQKRKSEHKHKLPAEGHERGKLAGKKNKPKPKGERKQKRHSRDDNVLKIID